MMRNLGKKTTMISAECVLLSTMETIPKSACKKIGYIQKQHGLAGELNLHFEHQFGDSLEEVDTLYVEHDGLLVPYFIEEDGLRFRSSEIALIQLEWVNSEKEAKALVGASVYIHEDDYIRADEDFTINELVGFQLIDVALGPIGKILQVDDFASNLLLTVSYKDTEVMLPYNENLVAGIDVEEKTIEMQCPEGIFDL